LLRAPFFFPVPRSLVLIPSSPRYWDAPCPVVFLALPKISLSSPSFFVFFRSCLCFLKSSVPPLHPSVMVFVFPYLLCASGVPLGCFDVYVHFARHPPSHLDVRVPFFFFPFLPVKTNCDRLRGPLLGATFTQCPFSLLPPLGDCVSHLPLGTRRPPRV